MLTFSSRIECAYKTGTIWGLNFHRWGGGLDKEGIRRAQLSTELKVEAEVGNMKAQAGTELCQAPLQLN